jgi:hypothetical protein
MYPVSRASAVCSGVVDGFGVFEQRHDHISTAHVADTVVVEAVAAIAEGGGATLHTVKLDVLAARDDHVKNS